MNKLPLDKEIANWQLLYKGISGRQAAMITDVNPNTVTNVKKRIRRIAKKGPFNESAEGSGIGRPKLKASERKDKIIQVRLKIDTFDSYSQIAKKKGKTISEWIRATLENEAKG